MFVEKKHNHCLHHHHFYHHHHQPNHHYHHHHSFRASWCRPCSRPFRMNKTHYNHNRHYQNPHHYHNHYQHYHNHYNYYHNHHHHIHDQHYHSFSSSLQCRLCLRSFGRMISDFPSSRLVTFLDTQTRKPSDFIKNIPTILFVFSKICSVYSRLTLQYLKLTEVYTIASLSSNIRVLAPLWRESLKKQTQDDFVLVLVTLTLLANFTYFIFQIGQTCCRYDI